MTVSSQTSLVSEELIGEKKSVRQTPYFDRLQVGWDDSLLSVSPEP
jgi:hypothetical protein